MAEIDKTEALAAVKAMLRNAIITVVVFIQRIQMEKTTRKMAYHDTLTGLPNRVLLLEIGHAEDAAAIARKIIEIVSHSLIINNNVIQITASIGIAMYPDDATIH